MGQIQLTVSLVMIALFAIAIIGFGISFAADNNAPISVSQDSSVSNLYTNSNGNLSGFSTNSESQYQSIIETTIAPGSQTAQSTGPFAITPKSVLGTPINMLQLIYEKIFGTGSGFGIFFTAIIAILTFMFGLFLYKTLRGFPD